MSSVVKDLSSGFIANFFGKFSNVFIHLVIGAILARLLSPKEFGVVSVVMVFVVFINMINDQGLGPAVIQKKDLSESDISTFFNFTLILAAVASGAFFSLSYPISLFYNNEVYVAICRLLSISVLCATLNIVPLALLRRRKKFRHIATIMVSVNLLTGAAAVILAWYGFSYYALVMRTVLQGILTFVLMFIFAHIQLKAVLNWQTIRSVIWFDFKSCTWQFVCR